MIIQRKRLMGMVLIIGLLLLIPLIAMQFTDEVNWSPFDFVLMGAFLLGIGLAYELVAGKPDLPVGKEGKTLYRFAFGIGLGGAFFLVWVNGAVGIIGSENQPANLLYGAVFVVAFVGALISRFKPQGMARTLFAATFVQLSIPIIALIIWPQVSWGEAGIVRVFIINAFFAILFILSAFLFRQASAS